MNEARGMDSPIPRSMAWQQKPDGRLHRQSENSSL